jgi:hypothetical protein
MIYRVMLSSAILNCLIIRIRGVFKNYKAIATVIEISTPYKSSRSAGNANKSGTIFRTAFFTSIAT